MNRILPILFNGDMVRAILECRKTATRRLVKYRKPPYRVGDILYVRETWGEWTGGYIYRAWPYPFPQPGCYPTTVWHPSIHMPKEIARIWLRVTDVRVERLQDITEEQAEAEGCGGYQTECKFSVSPCCHFMEVWDSTVNKRDADRYGWVANPWVWVIEFEKCGKPEPCIMKGIEPAEDKRPCIGYGDEWADEPCEMCKGCASCSGNM